MEAAPRNGAVRFARSHARPVAGTAVGGKLTARDPGRSCGIDGDRVGVGALEPFLSAIPVSRGGRAGYSSAVVRRGRLAIDWHSVRSCARASSFAYRFIERAQSGPIRRPKSIRHPKCSGGHAGSAFAVLLIGAGLFVATLRNARSSDVTFGTSNVLLAHVDLPTQRYSPERTKQFWPRLLDAARSLPGVTSASLVLVVPHAGTRGGTDVVFNQPIQVDFNIAAPEYFQTIGIPLVRGRDFNNRDDASAPQRAIVNEQFARRFWPGQDPVGKTFRTTRPSALVEVIGVVRDGKFRGFRADIQPCFYRPLYQQTIPDLTLEIRAAGSVTALVPAFRQAVAKLDPDLPLKDIRTWQEHVARSMARENMLATLLSGFGMLALLLASTGTYGVVSFAVAQRTREMGIRIALGATRANILRNVVGGILLPVTAGIVVGIAGALLLTRFVKNMLYGVGATDVAIFSAVIAIELAVALLAAYLPGRRATNVDPMTALRHE